MPGGHHHESVLNLGEQQCGATEGEESTASWPGQLVFLRKILRSVAGSRRSFESPGKKGTEVLWVFTLVQIALGKIDLGDWRGQNQESKMDIL